MAPAEHGSCPTLHSYSSFMPRSRVDKVLSRWLAAKALSAVGIFIVSLAFTAPAQAATKYPGGTWQPGPAQYGMKVVQTSVTMDDGVILPAKIGYPTDMKTGERVPGNFPVILMQDPYVFFNFPVGYFVQRGYIFAMVQIRGTLDTSGPNGEGIPFTFFGDRYAQDGAAVVDWAAYELDGSNGAIGLYGCSFLGIIQLFTASGVGPNSPVKAMVPACASGTFRNVFSANGIPSPVTKLFTTEAVGLVLGAPGSENTKATAAYAADLSSDIQMGGDRAYNRAFWQERNTDAAMAAKVVQNDIPTLLWSGWKAFDGTGSLQFFAALQNAWAGKSPDGPMTPDQPVTGRYQIVVGDWVHGLGLDNSLMLEWYDTWVRGVNTGMDKTSTPLHLYDTGNKTWNNAATYPITDTYTPYYFGENGQLTNNPQTAASAGNLAWVAPAETDGTLTYTTSALSNAITLGGPIAVKVYARSSNTNLTLIAVLQDVDAGGKATDISVGNVLGSLSAVDNNASWKDSKGQYILPLQALTHDEFLTPSKTQVFDFALWPVVRTIAAGHSLRLVLTAQMPSSKCNVAAAIGPSVPCYYTDHQQSTLFGGRYAIAVGGDTPSLLTLPILPAGRLQITKSGMTSASLFQTEPLSW